MDIEAQFGKPDEWKYFSEHNQAFLRILPKLKEILIKIFLREVETNMPTDSVVFLLGRLCAEDFLEILLLCGNGYGFGGMKILRGLFERTVTAAYIADNPEEADSFTEYHSVHERKLLNHAKQILWKGKSTENFPKEKINEIEERYESVKDKFQEVICKTCNRTRTQMSWSKMDLLSMSKKVNMEALYIRCYYEPTLQAHSTVSSVVSRMKEPCEGRLSFDEGPQRDKAKSILADAHIVVLHVLATQNKYFRLGLDATLQEAQKDFQAAWMQ